jgi:dethiobiotin synthetase
MQEKYFVTGIGTDIGKTIVSAILTEKLNADYWKPVQAGDLTNSDSIKVENLISNPISQFHPEGYRLNHPLSPHLSAKMDEIEIDHWSLKMPETDNPLIIEGAGGLMVPLNETKLVLDLIKFLDVPVIVVSKNYLGSINHTLLTLSTLKQHNITIKGIIFSGEENKASEEYILNYTQVSCLGKIPLLTQINKDTIKEAGGYISL